MPTGDFSEHDIVATLQDGRVIAMGRSWVVSSAGDQTPFALNVRVPDLREIEYVFQIEFYTDPDTYFEDGAAVLDKKITGNVVGFTLYGTHVATTLTAEVIAIGPP